MKKISYLLTVLALTISAQSQIKLRLQSDDVVESGFMTSSNANVLLGGLNNANSGLLNAVRGGTGQGVYAVGDFLYANGTGTLARLPAAQGLLTGGATPSWQNTSAGLAGALVDETGSGGNGKVMYSSSPTLVNNAGTGAGLLFDGDTTPTLAFLGMNVASDTVFRLYSFQTATNVISANLTSGATTFSGPITATAVSPQVAGAFIGGISVVNNKPTTEVAADFSNMVDANIQIQVTGVGAGTKFGTIGSSTDTAVQLRQFNTPRIILETDDSVTLTNPVAHSMMLNFTDANHSIVGRHNNTTGFANHYYAFGGALGNLAGHRFFTGGFKASQTPKLEIADDGIKASIPVSFSTFATARASRENSGVLTRYKTDDTTRVNLGTPTVDPDLWFSVAANEVYSFRIIAYVRSATSVSPDLKFGLSGTSAVSHIRYHVKVWTNGLLTAGGGADTAFNTGYVADIVDSSINHVVEIEGEGSFSSAGTVGLFWSQNNVNVDHALAVQKNSHLRAWRMN